ncbi:MAG: AI-2E family transporter [Clostridia bacterium]|nr:AI-2E family transporter [Clostridia bacterium]
MLFDRNKIPYLRLLPLLLIAFILFRLVNNAEILLSGLGFFLSILSYLFWAFAIAYLLNPMMVLIEKKLKIRRGLSIFLIYSAFTGIVVFCLTILVPMLTDNINQFLGNINVYANKLQKFLLGYVVQWQEFDKFNITDYIKENLNDVIKQASNILNFSMNAFFSKIVSLTSTVLKFIMAIIISIYFLYDKEDFINSLKKFIYAVVPREKGSKIIEFGGEVNETFKKYIVGRLMVAVIVGIVCFIGLFIIRTPYSLLISIIVGITNLIPYFGNLLGMIPAVVILLFISPIQALWVFIFLLVLSQFDSLFLSPKIIGDKVGLSPILIIVAITVGGAIYGIVGMLIGVPLMAVLKTLLSRFVDKRLAERDIKM